MEFDISDKAKREIVKAATNAVLDNVMPKIDEKFRRHLAKYVHTPVAAPPVTPTTPTTPALTPSGPMKIGAGSVYMIQSKLIQADKPYKPADANYFAGGEGISCSDAVESLTIRNSVIKAYRYGIWLGLKVGARLVILDHTTIECAPSGLGDGDDYCLRGRVVKFRSNDCHFKNSGGKGCVRIYDCIDFESVNDTYEGGRVMFGGGSADEWAAPLPFTGIVRGGRFKVQSVQVYDKSDVTFDDCDFAGTERISINGNGKANILPNCKNIKEITKNGVVQ